MNSYARRALMCVAATLLMIGSVAGKPDVPVVSALIVDVSPLRAKGLGPYADRVGDAVRVAVEREFADRLGRGGPRLVVRIAAISMRDYAGGEGRALGFGSGASTDYLEGEALLLDRSGQVLTRLPQLSAVPASSGGAWYDPASEQRRIEALAAHFSGWLRRRLP